MTLYMPRFVYPAFKRLIRGRVYSANELHKRPWLWKVRLVRYRPLRDHTRYTHTRGDVTWQLYGCAKRGCDAINPDYMAYGAYGKSWCLHHPPLRIRLRRLLGQDV